MKHVLNFLLLVITVIVFNYCNREFDDNYYIITEKSGNDQRPIFYFYTINDSIFICYYYQHYHDLIDKYTFAYGKYSINNNSIIFHDSLSSRNFVFIKKKKHQYYCISGFLRNYYLQTEKFVSNDEKNIEYFGLFDEIERIRDKSFETNELSLWENIDTTFVTRDTIILTDINRLIYLKLFPNSRFTISIEEIVIIRAGKYSIDKGLLTLNDTIDNVSEKAVFVSDTILIPINLPFYWQVHELKKVKVPDFDTNHLELVP